MSEFVQWSRVRVPRRSDLLRMTMGMGISWRFLPSESESEAEEGVSDVKKCMVEEEEVGKKGAR